MWSPSTATASTWSMSLTKSATQATHLFLRFASFLERPRRLWMKLLKPSTLWSTPSSIISPTSSSLDLPRTLQRRTDLLMRKRRIRRNRRNSRRMPRKREKRERLLREKESPRWTPKPEERLRRSSPRKRRRVSRRDNLRLLSSKDLWNPNSFFVLCQGCLIFVFIQSRWWVSLMISHPCMMLDCLLVRIAC